MMYVSYLDGFGKMVAPFMSTWWFGLPDQMGRMSRLSCPEVFQVIGDYCAAKILRIRVMTVGGML